MKKRKLLLPLVLIAMFLFCGSAFAAEVPTDVTVDMTESSSNVFTFDGRTMNSGAVVYHRFVVRKPSLVRMTGESYYDSGAFLANKVYGTFAVCNQDKNQLFSIDDYYAHDTDTPYSCFFLKAGTYYLRGQPYDPYSLKLSCKSFSRKVAKSKKKAVKIKKKKTVKGYFLAGEKDSHWYKLTLPKKQKIKRLYSQAFEQSVQMRNNNDGHSG